jgi:hypothetical protein
MLAGAGVGSPIGPQNERRRAREVPNNLARRTDEDPKEQRKSQPLELLRSFALFPLFSAYNRRSAEQACLDGCLSTNDTVPSYLHAAALERLYAD